MCHRCCFVPVSLTHLRVHRSSALVARGVLGVRAAAGEAAWPWQTQVRAPTVIARAVVSFSWVESAIMK